MEFFYKKANCVPVQKCKNILSQKTASKTTFMHGQSETKLEKKQHLQQSVLQLEKQQQKGLTDFLDLATENRSYQGSFSVFID